MPQHLTCVRAAQQITSAKVKGDYHGSSELFFYPGNVQAGNFSFDIGTAGSTSLVLQTLIPALVFADKGTTLALTGGTHVPYSPSFHYLSRVFACFLEYIGVRIRLSIESYGFYPRGGGRIRADIFPVEKVSPLQMKDRGDLKGITGCSAVGNLPLSIAQRQIDAFLSKSAAGLGSLKVFPDIDLLQVTSPGKGTFIDVTAGFENSIAGFTGLGAVGKRAETVGEEAAEQFIKYYHTGAAIDIHMADQIVVYLALSSGRSVFNTSAVTEHLKTNLWAIGLFHDIAYSFEKEEEKMTIQMEGKAPKRIYGRRSLGKGESNERIKDLAGGFNIVQKEFVTPDFIF